MARKKGSNNWLVDWGLKSHQQPSHMEKGPRFIVPPDRLEKPSNNWNENSKCTKDPVKEKKLQVPRYDTMVREAPVARRQRKGSFKKDILKYITSKYGKQQKKSVHLILL